MAACLGIRCECKGFDFERMSPDRWRICYCSHTEQTHSDRKVKNERQESNQEERTESPRKEKPAPSQGKASQPKRIGTAAGMTPAEARAKLRAAGFKVGQRGRLSPEQMAKAARL